MSYEKDDCQNCGTENATMIIHPNLDDDYNKVCGEACYQELGEMYEEAHNPLSW